MRGNIEAGMKHFLRSFCYSLSGLRYAVEETAIKQEIALGVFHVGWMICSSMSVVLKIVLTALLAIVFITELLNTAIESVVDLTSPGINPLAKRAKDLGSAAVFCSLVAYCSAFLVVVVKTYFV